MHAFTVDGRTDSSRAPKKDTQPNGICERQFTLSASDFSHGEKNCICIVDSVGPNSWHDLRLASDRPVDGMGTKNAPSVEGFIELQKCLVNVLFSASMEIRIRPITSMPSDLVSCKET